MLTAIAAMLIAAVAQRLAGTGLGMVSAPFLILAFGPSEGVVLVLLFGVVASLANLWSVRHLIDWAVLARMQLPSLLGSLSAHWR